MVDVAFDLMASAPTERAARLERLDQRQNPADVVWRRFAQAFQILVRDHRADAVVQEQFEQQAAVERIWDDVRTRDPAAARADGMLQVEARVTGNFAAF